MSYVSSAPAGSVRQAHRVRCRDVARAALSCRSNARSPLQDLADEAFRDLLKKHRRDDN